MPSPLIFSAMLIAGGQSKRMGTDKAGVLFCGHLLWQRQCDALKAARPAELFISGKTDGPYAGNGYDIICDEQPELGPLAGLAAGLRHCHAEWLLVLAIDLPCIPSAFLEGLTRKAADSGNGLVPCDGQRFYPLAALYPKKCLPLAEEGLRSPDRSLQAFSRRAVRAGLLASLEILAEEMPWFENVNTPEDLRRVAAAESRPKA